MTRRRRGRDGFTLIEVCVSAMIVAIGATALFAVALSTRRTIAVSPVREEMHQYSRLLLETLKTYVTPDTSNVLGAPNGSWALCGGDAGQPWALGSGGHNADCLLPARLKDAPPAGSSAQLRYTVLFTGGARRITVNMQWTEPE